MALEDVVRCPICGSTSFQPSLTCTDHTVSREVFHVKHCQQCTLGITSPRPYEQEAARYYQSQSYISHASQSTGMFDSIYLAVRHLTTRWKYRMILPYLATRGLLDFGCGTGTFLQYVQNAGHPVQGMEPSSQARSVIPSSIPVAKSLETIPEKLFDVITLWHVLEHVYPLRETVRELIRRLAPGGAIFIAVPNHESQDAAHYQSHWAAYDVPRHIWHFNRKSMAEFLQQEGLTVKAILPMKLDAYYVSLLSERYTRSGSIGLSGALKALVLGFQSNTKARARGNYSSLIFVAQK